MWSRSGPTESAEELNACAYCDLELLPGSKWLTLELEEGDGEDRFQFHYLWFCSQNHAGLFLVERELPADEESSALDSSTRARTRLLGAAGWTGVAVLVAANAGFYVLGFVTWLRWIWR